MNTTKMKNPTAGRAMVSAAVLVVSALHANAALVAYEGFDYDGSGAITGENGGSGRTAIWDTTGVTGLSESSIDQSLSFDQAPALATDGSIHVASNANLGNSGGIRRRH